MNGLDAPVAAQVLLFLGRTEGFNPWIREETLGGVVWSGFQHGFNLLGSIGVDENGVEFFTRICRYNAKAGVNFIGLKVEQASHVVD